MNVFKDPSFIHTCSRMNIEKRDDFLTTAI